MNKEIDSSEKKVTLRQAVIVPRFLFATAKGSAKDKSHLVRRVGDRFALLKVNIVCKEKSGTKKIKLQAKKIAIMNVKLI